SRVDREKDDRNTQKRHRYETGDAGEHRDRVGHAAEIGADVEDVGGEQQHTNRVQQPARVMPPQSAGQPNAAHQADARADQFTATISGSVSTAVHSVLYPSVAPATA